MRTHILADDVVKVELTASEHVALADAIAEAIDLVHPERMTELLVLDEDAARAFVESLRGLEHDAVSRGVTWLQPQRSEGADGLAVLHVEFHDDGAQWHVSLEQLAFIEACAAREHALVAAVDQSPTHSE